MAKEITEKKAKQEAEARTYPVAGTVAAAVIMNSAGEALLTTCHDASAPAGDVSVRVLQWLAAANAVDPVSDYDPRTDCGIRLFGFGIADFMGIMFLDALGFARATRTDVDIPLGLWYHAPFEQRPWADPFHILIPSERRDRDIDRQGLCDFLGIPCPDDLMDDPGQMANVARLMALKGQLFPAPPTLSR